MLRLVFYGGGSQFGFEARRQISTPEPFAFLQMRVEGMVSLWVGQADSPAAFDAYLQMGYSKDGDLIPSSFGSDFRIRYYDEDFREVKYCEDTSRSVRELLRGCSYDNVIVPKFIELCGESFSEDVNAVVLLYNFDYEGAVKANRGGAVRLRFVGSITLD